MTGQPAAIRRRPGRMAGKNTQDRARQRARAKGRVPVLRPGVPHLGKYGGQQSIDSRQLGSDERRDCQLLEPNEIGESFPITLDDRRDAEIPRHGRHADTHAGHAAGRCRTDDHGSGIAWFDQPKRDQRGHEYGRRRHQHQPPSFPGVGEEGAHVRARSRHHFLCTFAVRHDNCRCRRSSRRPCLLPAKPRPGSGSRRCDRAAPPER
jgi:hypothetical protein